MERKELIRFLRVFFWKRKNAILNFRSIWSGSLFVRNFIRTFPIFESNSDGKRRFPYVWHGEHARSVTGDSVGGKYRFCLNFVWCCVVSFATIEIHTMHFSIFIFVWVVLAWLHKQLYLKCATNVFVCINAFGCINKKSNNIKFYAFAVERMMLLLLMSFFFVCTHAFEYKHADTRTGIRTHAHQRTAHRQHWKRYSEESNGRRNWRT